MFCSAAPVGVCMDSSKSFVDAGKRWYPYRFHPSMPYPVRCRVLFNTAPGMGYTRTGRCKCLCTCHCPGFRVVPLLLSAHAWWRQKGCP